MAIALEYIFIFNAAFTGIAFVVFAIGACLMSISLTEDLKCDLESLNKYTISKNDRIGIFTHFCQFVQFHSDAKQLSVILAKDVIIDLKSTLCPFFFRLVVDFSDLMQLPCIFLFSWGIAAICILMLMLQNQIVQYFSELFRLIHSYY